MLLFERFLTVISNLIGNVNPLAGREAELARLNPNKIYIENVRSLLGVSHREAVRICESAVRQGAFAKGVEVLCPDDVVAASAPSEVELPPVVRCWVDRDGDLEEEDVNTATLRKLVFYRLNDGEQTGVFRQTA